MSLGSNNNSTSRAVHEKSNRLIEKLSRIIYFAAMRLAVPGIIFPKPFSLISFTILQRLEATPLNYNFQEGMLSDHFFCCSFIELKFCNSFNITRKNCSLPFDWKTPFGYFFAEIWAYITAFVVLRFLACMAPLALAFFFSCCCSYQRLERWSSSAW